MQYLGDITSGTTIRGSFNTRTASGVPITLGGTPVLSVYKDAATTETTTGVTLTVDFDSRTGHHVFAVVTTDGFYATGSDYRVVITTGTVDGTSVVGTEVGSFSIQNRNVGSGSGLDAAGVRSAIGLASANLDTQLAAIDDAIDTEVAAIKAKTDLIPAAPAAVGDIPTASAITTAVWGAGTRTLTSFGTLVADVQSGLATESLLTTVAGYLDTEIAAIKAVTDKLDTAMVLDGAVYQFTVNALENGPSGSGLDAAGVRAAIGLTTANLDTQLADIPTVSEFNARSLPSADYFVVGDYTAPPTAANIVDAMLDDELETGFSVARTLRIIGSASAGKVRGGPDGPIFRNLSDTADQITGVATEDGNRTSATYGT
jgi:hypothetical protein